MTNIPTNQISCSVDSVSAVDTNESFCNTSHATLAAAAADEDDDDG